MTHLRIAIREFVDFENALTAQIGSFRAAHPDVSVEVVPMDLETLYRCLVAKRGLHSGLWDLALLITDWLPEAIEAGLLEPLTPYMAARPIPDWPEGWPSSLVDPLQFDGRCYCLPWHDGPECLMYRRDLFASPQHQSAFRNSVGYDMAPPRTWEQFEETARFFTRPEEGLYGTAFACYPDGHNTLYDFALQVWSRGGELQDERGRPALATAESAAALDFYRRVVRDPAVCHPRSIDLDSVASGELFLSGSIAMMVNWFGFAARSGRPGSPLEGKVALAPIPCEGGAAPVSLSAFWSMAMAAGSRNREASYEFLRFLARPEMDREVVRHGVVGVRLSTWRDPEVQKINPAYGAIERISQGARRLPRTPGLPAFAAIVNSVVERALHSEEPSLSILEWAEEEAIGKNIRFL